MQLRITSASLFEPHVPETDLPCAVLLDLQRDQPLCLECGPVVIDQNGHDVAIDDVCELIAACDDVNLIPLTEGDELHQLVPVTERTDRARTFAGLGSDNVPSPDDLRVGAAGAGILDVAVVAGIVIPVDGVSAHVP